MGLETSATISGMNGLWPLGTDPRSEGDNHLRLIKTVLQAVFADDATSIKLKVPGVDFVRGGGLVQNRFYDDNGTTLRATVQVNTGATIANVQWDARDNTGTVKNRMTMNESGLFMLNGGMNAPGQFASKQSFVLLSAAGVNRMNLTAELSVADGYAAMAALNSSGVEQGRVAVNKDSVMGRGTTAWDIINDTNERLRMREETSFGAAAYHKISLFDNNGVHDYSEEWTAGVKRYYNAQAFEMRTITGVQRGEFRFNHGTALSEIYIIAYNGSGVAERGIHMWGGNILFTNSSQALLTKNANGSGAKASWRTDLGNANGWTAISAMNDAGAITASLAVDTANAMWVIEGVGSYRILTTKEILTDTNDVNTGYGLGETIIVYTNGVTVNRNSTLVPCLSAVDSRLFRLQGQPNASTVVPGSWRARGMLGSDYVAAEKVGF